MKHDAGGCKVALLTLLLQISFVFAGERAGTPRYGGTLRIALDGAIGSVHPFKTHFRQHFGYQRFYAEGLVDLDAQANLVPGLAQSWEISPDGRVYTFKIRKGVKFHNGEELTADDVKWSLDYALDQKNAVASRLNLNLVDTVEVLDRTTVRARLKKASTPFLSNLYGSSLPVVPRAGSGSLDSAPIGTGPFAFEEWKQGLHLKLRRFRDYWKRGKPYVDDVVFRFVPDEDVRFTALRTGDVEIADELPPQKVAEFKGSAQRGFQTLAVPGGGYMLLVLNTQRPPLNNVRIRQAIALALDKQEIVNATRWGAGEATNQRYPKSSPWFFDVQDRRRDPQAARKLLAEAGLPQGFKSPIMVSKRTLPTAEVLQAQLKMVGILLEFQQFEDATRLAKQWKRDFDMDLRGEGYPIDPEGYFQYYYSKTGLRNFTGYSNPEFDRLYEEALVELDFQRRKSLYTQMTRMIERDLPEILLYSTHRYFGWREGVKGFEPNLGAVTLYSGGGVETTWIDKP